MHGATIKKHIYILCKFRATVYHQPFPCYYRVADKSLARPGRKQATATENFEFHIAYL